MGRTGSIASMGRLGARLNELAAIPSRASRSAAERITELLSDEYAAGVDPYGNAWAGLAESTIDRGRFPPPLTDSGNMAGGTSARAESGKGISVSLPFPGSIHMTGASKGPNWRMPARPVLPKGAMPPAWKAAIDDSMREAFGKAMGKR